MHQLEFILDSLVDEKDRSTQKRGEGTNGRLAGTGPGHGSTNSASDGSSQLSLEISVSRPAEIEAALQQFVSPKVTSLVNSYWLVSLCARQYIMCLLCSTLLLLCLLSQYRAMPCSYLPINHLVTVSAYPLTLHSAFFPNAQYNLLQQRGVNGSFTTRTGVIPVLTPFAMPSMMSYFRR